MASHPLAQVNSARPLAAGFPYWHFMNLSRRWIPAVLLGALAACLPAPTPQTGPQVEPTYVVRVTSGDRDVAVDWAILPDEGWPVENGRDHTPFQAVLPQGRSAALFRPTGSNETLTVAILRRARDGFLTPLQEVTGLPIALVVVNAAGSVPSVVGPPETPSGAP